MPSASLGGEDEFGDFASDDLPDFFGASFLHQEDTKMSTRTPPPVLQATPIPNQMPSVYS
jgi:hypothetical protein